MIKYELFNHHIIFILITGKIRKDFNNCSDSLFSIHEGNAFIIVRQKHVRHSATRFFETPATYENNSGIGNDV